MKILYIATNFTAITHTFITREIGQLQNAGVEVDLLSVRTHTEQEGAVNPECDLSRTRNIYPVSKWQILRGVARVMATRPARFLSGVRLVLGSRQDTGRTRWKLLYQLAVTTTLAREIDSENYDWIHAHFASSPTTFALFLHLLTGVPYSFTGHAVDIFRESSALKAKLANAARVVSISAYNHDHYNTIVPGLPTVRIHCGIDPANFPFRHRLRTGTPLRILSVGRSVPKKGFEYLIEALKLVSDTGVAWHCDIVGGGPLEESLREQAKRLGLDALALRGPLQQDQIRELLDQADLFVLPCTVTEDGDRDNIPVSLMEAMAVGCPVISTAVAGIPELIGEKDEFGVTVEQRDARSIAAAIVGLVRNPDRYAELSRNGRLRVMQDFNVERSAEQLFQFFSGH